MKMCNWSLYFLIYFTFLKLVQCNVTSQPDTDEMKIPMAEPSLEELGLPEDTSDTNRTKKEISPNKHTKIVSILFENEDAANLTVEDFIIRLQEKYEYKICETYLHSVPDPQNNFFRYDASLTEPLEGDDVYKREKRDKIQRTLPYRYRMFGEQCDLQAEWEFWYEMFLIAQNDTIKFRRESLPVNLGSVLVGAPATPPPPPTVPSNVTLIPTSTTTTTTTPSTTASMVITTTRLPQISQKITDEDFAHLQFTPRELMHKWNEVWVKFTKRGVCNQKLLLECLPEEKWDPLLGYVPSGSGASTCQCRRIGVGLPSIRKMVPITGRHPVARDYFTTQYYYDDYDLINDKEVRKYGSYRHTLGCAVQVNLPNSTMDVHITNPCDLFLPMIGLCRATCVENASCASVDSPEKLAVKKLAKNNAILRVQEDKLHETYHNKCICMSGKHCRKVTEEELGHGKRVRPISHLIPFISLLIIVHNNLFVFKIN